MFLIRCICVRGAGEEALQGSGLDACLIQLVRGAGSRGEALDPIAPHYRGTADDGERGCLATPGHPENQRVRDFAVMQVQKVWRAVVGFERSQILRTEMLVRL